MLDTLSTMGDRDGLVEVRRYRLWDVAVALKILERGGDINELHPAQWESLLKHLKHYLDVVDGTELPDGG